MYSMNNSIKINDLSFYTNIGISNAERSILQLIIISISFDFDFTQAAINDDLSLTVDYSKVAALCKSIVMKPHKLIETVGYEIGQKIKSDFKNVSNIKISVKKPEVQLGMKVKEVEICYCY